LKSKRREISFNFLSDLVLKLLTAGADVNHSQIVNALQEGMPAIKGIATSFKKHSSTEKSQQQSE
jgi:outer membrane lipoprotein-sorting protein